MSLRSVEQYVEGLRAVLAWDRHSRAQGLLAADVAPEGFLTARIDFIGRARSLQAPRALETLAFSPAQDAGAHPTFDPIGSLLLGVSLASRGRSGDRVHAGASALAFHECLGRRPDQGKVVQLEKKEVGRRIDAAQGAVELQGRGRGRSLRALREHDLEGIAGADVVFRQAHRCFVVAAVRRASSRTAVPVG